MASRTIILTASPQARASYLALASVGRRLFSATAPQQTSPQYQRSDFTSQGFTEIYEPGQPTGGPLAGASLVGTPRITPKALKEHLDRFVVGQDRAKEVLSTTVYNHYQRIQELQRQEDARAEAEAQALRQEMGHRNPIEDEFPGQQPTMNVSHPLPEPPVSSIADETEIEKSNMLILGPSGVGKTLMTKTLARVLDVPFATSDCTAFTQAGYVGEDAEACIHRLLAVANYDVAAAERGIVCLDEIDKIARAKIAHGKDIAGEGVQQSLLKILEGTTLQIQPKPDKVVDGRNPNGPPSHTNTTGRFSSSNTSAQGKAEVYNVRTDNILFICTGAFVSLEKIILERISRRSIGFGAQMLSSKASSGSHETLLKGQDALFKKHLPFYTPANSTSSGAYIPQTVGPANVYNLLDLVESSDLQKYGMIPELLGRIPISCAVSALDEEALVRVLTEPKNSLLKQFEKQFQLSGIELRFTSYALHEIAKRTSGMGTGARGLRTVLERLLQKSAFETPGSHVKQIAITKEVAQLKSAPLYFERGQSRSFYATIRLEEDEWKEEMRKKESAGQVSSFEEFRKQDVVAGAGGVM